MVFSTNLFLFVFLPIFLGIYYALPFRARSAWILFASYAFYGWWRVDFLLLFFAVTLWTFLWGKRIARAETPKAAKTALTIAIVGDFLSLGYFKYFNFGIDNINGILNFLGSRPITLWEVILPIGISFYVFQAVSYLIDVYRKDVEAADNFWDFSAFIALFPQLIAGPILRYKDLAHQFKARTHTLEKFSEGATRFMMGFCKKVLIADAIAPVVDLTLFHATPTMADAWFGAFVYTLQIFFDFSGYSDMAIGLGLMMGFRFKENFNHPYISRSVGEFWRRWHMSLSGWLREYLYYPLGGNRKGQFRTYFNVAAVMILIGIWHGADWTFVIYGCIHASLVVRERHFIYTKRWKERPVILGIALTMFFVIFARVLFVSPDMLTALNVYKGIFGGYGFALSSFVAWQVSNFQIFMIIFATVFVYAAPAWLAYVEKHPFKARLEHAHLAVIPLFMLGIARLSAQEFSPFLYFNF